MPYDFANKQLKDNLDVKVGDQIPQVMKFKFFGIYYAVRP